MTSDSGNTDIGDKLSDEGIAERDSYSITYDEGTETYHVSIGSNEQIPVDVSVIQASATITRSDPLELEPLAEYIDPDRLQGLFDSNPSSQFSRPTVSFSYIGYQITVESPTEMRVSS